MTIEEIRESLWYQQRPEVIRHAIELMPPIQLYRFKESGKQCEIIGYEEPASKQIQDVTLIVQKTGVGGALADMGFGAFDSNAVFGVGLNDLEPWEDETE